MTKIVTVKEVAEYLRLNQNTVVNLAVKGDLPGFKIGNSWRFYMDEIITAIDELKEKSRRGHFLTDGIRREHVNGSSGAAGRQSEKT
jgi:excisionase family DNA binding protein